LDSIATNSKFAVNRPEKCNPHNSDWEEKIKLKKWICIIDFLFSSQLHTKSDLKHRSIDHDLENVLWITILDTYQSIKTQELETAKKSRTGTHDERARKNKHQGYQPHTSGCCLRGTNQYDGRELPAMRCLGPPARCPPLVASLSPARNPPPRTPPNQPPRRRFLESIAVGIATTSSPGSLTGRGGARCPGSWPWELFVPDRLDAVYGHATPTRIVR
jgi:hypothetical protein